jgi:chemotaxis protein CheD
MAEQRTVTVGIGEVFVTRDISLVLVGYGLGSCIGVAAYDPTIKGGGIAHIMLPNSKEASSSISGCRFADIAVPTLVQELSKLGASPANIECKIVGGAQMLTAPGHEDSFKIGQRNIKAVREILLQYGIVPKAADTGGTQGRTLRLFIDSGRVFVRTVGRGDVEL